jgi:hypothetical protein
MSQGKLDSGEPESASVSQGFSLEVQCKWNGGILWDMRARTFHMVLRIRLRDGFTLSMERPATAA